MLRDQQSAPHQAKNCPPAIPEDAHGRLRLSCRENHRRKSLCSLVRLFVRRLPVSWCSTKTILAVEVTRAGISPWAVKVEKELKGNSSSVSRLFDVVQDCLSHLASDKKLPGKLADTLDRKVSAILDHARGFRNKSGHPTGANVPANDVEADLLLFPGFYSFLINDLCKILMLKKPDNGASA